MSIQPWERQPTEGAAAYRHFVAWLDAGRPKLRDFIKDYPLSFGRVRSYSGMHGWRKRGEAYFDWLQSERSRQMLQAMQYQAIDQAETLKMALTWIHKSLDHYLSSDIPIPIGDLPAFLKNVVELQRLVTDQSTQNVAVSLSGVPRERLEALSEALEAVHCEHAPKLPSGD